MIEQIFNPYVMAGLLILAIIIHHIFNRGKYYVVRVIDGDTIAVHKKRNPQKKKGTFTYKGEKKIRLIGVNTPESKKSFKDVEPYGKESAKWLKDKLLGKCVKLEYDERKKDKFKRDLCYVYHKSTMINHSIISSGNGFAAPVKPNLKYIKKFSGAQNYAKQRKLGLWKIYKSETEIRSKYYHLDKHHKFRG